MTIIAKIMYNNGAVTVTDSRYTTVSHYFFISYDDRGEKTFASYDRDLVIATGGSKGLGQEVVEYLLGNEEGLKKFCTTGYDSIRKDIIDRTATLAMQYGAGEHTSFLISVRLDGGDVRSLLLKVKPFGPTGRKPDVKLDGIEDHAVIGIDRTVGPYLSALVQEHAPDKGERSAADAMAIAFLLEDRYMEEHYSIRYHHRTVYGVGGPINISVTDRRADLKLVIDREERRRLEAMGYDALKRYFEDRVATALHEADDTVRDGAQAPGRQRGKSRSSA